MNQETAFVIAHFHPNGKVANHLKKLIESLSQEYENIVFASTNISDDDFNYISKYVNILKVENIGYDFWSYKNGLDVVLKNETIEKVFIINSSLIFLEPNMVKKIAEINDGFVGLRALTISNEHKTHAQSFFVSFEGKSFIRSKDMSEWWGNLIPISNRQEVIDKYEIGMSQYFLSKGYQIKSVFSPTNKDKLIALSRAIGNGHINIELNTDESQIILDVNHILKLNPTHYFWDFLLNDFGIIKIELLKNNSTNQNLQPFLSELKIYNPYFYALVEDALI